MTQTVMGMFSDRAAAEQAVSDLKDAGFAPGEISVAMSNQTRAQEFAEDTGTHAAEGTAWGGWIGGVIGFVIAAATATGTVVATGGATAPFIVGPLAAAWAGAGIGAVSGGIIGWLVGLGIPEERAREYETALNQGGILVSVSGDSVNAASARRILADEGATTVAG